jgi:hypothetical protein
MGKLRNRRFRYIREPESKFLSPGRIVRQYPGCLPSEWEVAGESGSGLGESVKRARASKEGRERGDGHLPSASQSNHFPNLLFCLDGAGLTGRTTCAVTQAGRSGVRNKSTPEMIWLTIYFRRNLK